VPVTVEVEVWVTSTFRTSAERFRTTGFAGLFAAGGVDALRRGAVPEVVDVPEPAVAPGAVAPPVDPPTDLVANCCAGRDCDVLPEAL